ncbi:MAG: hypothetical protein HN348_22660 [Proteobacteria bacterium]|nr:hypothetical protein [Pseudomonadota bacterium]
MLQLNHTHKLLGNPPQKKRSGNLYPLNPAHDYHCCFVDGDHSAVGAVLYDGVLWVVGQKMAVGWHRVHDEWEEIDFAESAPPWVDREYSTGMEWAGLRWARLKPRVGMSVLLGDGGVGRQCQKLDLKTLNAVELLEQVLEALEKVPTGGFLQKWFAKPKLSGVLLALQLTDTSLPRCWCELLEHLQDQGFDLSVAGSEAGPGIQRAMFWKQGDLREVMVEELRGDHTARSEVVPSAEGWLEIAREFDVSDQEIADMVKESGFEPFVTDDWSQGWIHWEEPGYIERYVRATRGDYLDRGTPASRSLFHQEILGGTVLELATKRLEKLCVLGYYSAVNEDEAVIAYHLVAGVCRKCNRLEGVLLQRVWT